MVLDPKSSETRHLPQNLFRHINFNISLLIQILFRNLFVYGNSQSTETKNTQRKVRGSWDQTPTSRSDPTTFRVAWTSNSRVQTSVSCASSNSYFQREKLKEGTHLFLNFQVQTPGFKVSNLGSKRLGVYTREPVL